MYTLQQTMSLLDVNGYRYTNKDTLKLYTTNYILISKTPIVRGRNSITCRSSSYFIPVLPSSVTNTLNVYKHTVWLEHNNHLDFNFFLVDIF